VRSRRGGFGEKKKGMQRIQILVAVDVSPRENAKEGE